MTTKLKLWTSKGNEPKPNQTLTLSLIILILWHHYIYVKRWPDLAHDMWVFFEKMLVRSEEKGFGFPYIFDADQSVYPKFGATKTPHVFLLNKDMVVEYIGSIDNSPNDPSKVTEKYLENAIAALEKGDKPNPATTKAIGCSIKVKK